MKSDEKELIRRSKEGDAAAFGEIVRRYQQPVYAAAFQIVRDPTAAQDLAQEAFISAFAALADLKSEDAFPSWLRRIALNKALASLKEQGRLAPLEEAAGISSRPESMSRNLPPTAAAPAGRLRCHGDPRNPATYPDTPRVSCTPVPCIRLGIDSPRYGVRFLLRP